jgi:hypothetical protein
MPSYRLFRLKEGLRPHFRQLPHLSGVAQLKPRDYEESVTIDANSRYAAWSTLQDSAEPILVGDALLEDGMALYVTKFVGMEPAEWIVPASDAKQAPLEAVPVLA